MQEFKTGVEAGVVYVHQQAQLLSAFSTDQIEILEGQKGAREGGGGEEDRDESEIEAMEEDSLLSTQLQSVCLGDTMS